jgi:glycosyltransferase involved in cell wall biosynthesis
MMLMNALSRLSQPITVDALPVPPLGRAGWPWTIGCDPLPATLPDGSPWPRISIVTPSYNQAEFLEETIRSVLLQGYPNLEYIIIDGGSTDATIDIIKKYESYIAYWVSEPDRGQSNALNKGIQRATGQVLGWQNSDDFYQPNAFKHAISKLQQDPTIDIVYGKVDSIDQGSQFIQSNYVSAFNLIDMIPWANMFNQSMFFRLKDIADQTVAIDEAFHHYMDLDLFWRLALQGRRFAFVPEISACFRLHDNAKGFTQYEIAAREAVKIYLRIYADAIIPHPVRQKALTCAMNQCIDAFDKLKLDLCQDLFKTIWTAVGPAAANPQLLAKVTLSYTGLTPIRRLKQLFNILRRRPMSNDLSQPHAQ